MIILFGNWWYDVFLLVRTEKQQIIFLPCWYLASDKWMENTGQIIRELNNHKRKRK